MKEKRAKEGRGRAGTRLIWRPNQPTSGSEIESGNGSEREEKVLPVKGSVGALGRQFGIQIWHFYLGFSFHVGRVALRQASLGHCLFGSSRDEQERRRELDRNQPHLAPLFFCFVPQATQVGQLSSLAPTSGLLRIPTWPSGGAQKTPFSFSSFLLSSRSTAERFDNSAPVFVVS